MESILTSIKQLLMGSCSDDASFDPELIIHINGALSVMTQLGAGPSAGFRISGATETWADFLGDRIDLDTVITDVYLRVRLLFDPPQNSFLVAAIENQIAEMDWRIEERSSSTEV